MKLKEKRAYWAKNRQYIYLLLGIWFFFSFICSILAVSFLNDFQILGFKLGFWFAQQGSIYAFVIIIFVYVYLMNRLDKKYGVDE
ncbi:MAG: DUF4212 domain-containing protein [bacterium]|nr:DUF4212 domain-containing protein [bacterium]